MLHFCRVPEGNRRREPQQRAVRRVEREEAKAKRAYLAAFLALCFAIRRPVPRIFLDRFFASLICLREVSFLSCDTEQTHISRRDDRKRGRRVGLPRSIDDSPSMLKHKYALGWGVNRTQARRGRQHNNGGWTVFFLHDETKGVQRVCPSASRGQAPSLS